MGIMMQQDVLSIDMEEGATQGLTATACLQRGLAQCESVDRASLIEAHMWFNIAYARGNRQALQYRQELSAEMTNAEIIEAQKKAREWLARNSN